LAVLSTSANIATPGLPVGSIQAFAGANAPTGWLLCDGSAVSRGNYPDLYNTIGNTYGSGDGATTFNLPDLRGRVPAGKDNMGGTAANRLTTSHFGGTATNLGASGGSESHTLTTAQLAAHNHGVTDPGHVHQYGVYGGSFGDGSGAASLFTGFPLRETRSTGNNATNISIQNNGSGNAHNNTQPTLIVNYIIKAVADIARGGWYTQSSPPVVTQLPSNPAINDQVIYSPFGDGSGVFQYNGSTWKSLGGKVLLKTTTVSSASEVRFENVFISQFSNFEINYRCTGFSSTSGGQILLRLLNGTTDISNSAYHWSRHWVGSNAATGFDNAAAVAQLQLNATGANMSTTEMTGDIFVSVPNSAVATTFRSLSNLREPSGPATFTMRVGGTHETATAYDGFRIFPNSGTMSAVVSVYGVAK
jgi:microcystin-dependent protein